MNTIIMLAETSPALTWPDAVGMSVFFIVIGFMVVVKITKKYPWEK